MSLCQVCQQAIPEFAKQDGVETSNSPWAKIDRTPESDRWSINKTLYPHSTWESFTESLTHDCPICWTLWRFIRSSPVALPNDEKMESFRTVIRSIIYDSKLAQYHIPIYCKGKRVNGGKIWTGARFLVWKTTETYFVEAEQKNRIPDEHTPASAADCARRWLGLCDAEHSVCVERGLIPKDAIMPTRLLDLGAGDSKTWRIFETRDRVTYIALSHRWSENTPQLLQSNRQKYCNPQPDSVLPQDYQDIIAICRAIPIRFLWIDSLCILQDDGGLDFRREAPLMMDIYQYSLLTLTICWDFAGSTVFRKCRPRSIPLHPWPDGPYKGARNVPDPTSWPGGFAFVQCLPDISLNVSDAPINRRGWVLQERCLSRRILYLGNDQLYWECDGESNGGSEEGYVTSEATLGSIRSDHTRQSIYLPPGDGRWDSYWGILIEKYTECELTFEKDRLIAVAGVARVMSKRTGKTYFAGIWLENWIKGVFWKPLEKRRPKLKPPQGGENEAKLKPPFSAPSWSWVSFSGSVMTESLLLISGDLPNFSSIELNSFNSPNHRPLAILRETAMTPPDSNPYFSFDKAILKIKCLLIPLNFDSVTDKERLQGTDCSEEIIDLWLSYDVDFRATGLEYLQLGDRDRTAKQSTLELMLSRPFNPSLPCFFMPLFVSNVPIHNVPELTFHEGRVHGLVIQETLQGEIREFERIGILAEEGTRYPQLSSMIINTIVEKGIGRAPVSAKGPAMTKEERAFESKLGGYAAAQVSIPVNLSSRGIFRDIVFDSGFEVKEEEIREMEEMMRRQSIGETNGTMVKCSCLPHFATAQWTTVSLV